MWRDTAIMPKFFILDARSMFPLLIWAFHMRMWTFCVAVVGITFFAVLERRGISIEVMFRMMKCKIAGRYKTVSRVSTWRRRCRSS